MPKQAGCLFSLFGYEKETARNLPYERCEGLLTQAERSFQYALIQALEVMGLKAAVCPKVGLRDVFRVVAQDNAEYMTYLDKIDRKHVDFLLADPRGMQLIAGVQLDGNTHLSERAKARDVFVEQVYQAAGLPLLRFRVQHDYDIPDMARYMRQELGLASKGTETVMTGQPAPFTADNGGPVPRKQTGSEESTPAADHDMPDGLRCPRCGAPMVLRKARRGKRRGQYFWRCSRFPRCRCVVDMKVKT